MIKYLQGDIIGMLDNNLNEVVKYTYNSWGKTNSKQFWNMHYGIVGIH